MNVGPALRPVERAVLGGVIALLVLTAGLVVVLQVTRGRSDWPAGRLLVPPKPVYDFTLNDQNGVPYHLSASSKKVIVLALIYTSCNDECPFISEKMKVVRTLLGNDANQVDFVPITVDPTTDTQARRLAYSKELGLQNVWHFLGGTVEQLAPVWSAYLSMDHDAAQEMWGPDVTTGLTTPQVTDASKVLASFGTDRYADHGMIYWIIDRTRRVVDVLDVATMPGDLANDIRWFLK